jgi:hypothetical protein
MRARARLNLDFDITKHNILDLHLSAFARRSSVATKGPPKNHTFFDERCRHHGGFSGQRQAHRCRPKVRHLSETFPYYLADFAQAITETSSSQTSLSPARAGSSKYTAALSLLIPDS